MPDPGASAPHSTGSRPGCPGIEALEALAAFPGVDAPPDLDAVAAHVGGCEACSATLAEMRAAEGFLARFRGSVTSGPERPASGDPAAPFVKPRSSTVRVEGYAVEGLLAFGGQGEVYKARQIGTERLVALKVPHGDTQTRPSTRYRFEREVELAARLDHPGVVRIFGSCTLDDGRLACVMEFVEGESIDKWALTTRGLGIAGLRRIVSVLAEVADAIAYAHLRAVLHRDIKPGNVIVTGEDRPRVLDFGLAKAIDGSGSSFATVTGAFLGTLAYAAPEQISTGADAVDIRTDVYALGLLLYQALTGVLPYPTDAPTLELLRQIREVAPPRPSTHTPGVGHELDAIVLKALAKEKDRRYTTAAEFRDDLRAWLEGRAVRARFDSRWYVMRKTMQRHRWALAWAAALVAVAATVGGLGLVVREQASRARLADAVREAQIIEAHHVRMAEARAMSIDNFLFGETAAWNALLDPAPVLIERGIEGVTAEGLPPGSSAFWTLWEIYQHTPVIASVPEPATVSGVFTGIDDRILTVDDRGLTLWDWRRWSPVHRVGFEEEISHVIAGFGQILIRTTSEQVYVSDARAAEWRPIGGSGSVYFSLGVDRAMTLSPDRRSYELWDTTIDPAGRLATFTAEREFWGSTFFSDQSGRYFAFIDDPRGVTVVDAGSGEIRLSRVGAGSLRPALITATREPGIFIAYGQDGALRIDMGPDAREPSIEFFSSMEAAGIPQGTEYLAVRPGVGRALARMNHSMTSVVEAGTPATDSPPLRNLTNILPDLSHDGRHMAIGFKSTGRVSIYDLDARPARRLPFPSPPGPRGYGTIFDLAFSADGRALYAASMDGSVRVFDIAGDGAGARLAEGVEGGVSRIAITDAGLLIAGHDIGADRASLSLLTHAGEMKPITTARRRFNSLIVEPGRTALALTDNGEVLRVDLPTGEVLTRAVITSTTILARSMAAMPDDGPLLVSTNGGAIVELDPRTLETRREITPPLSIRKLMPHPTEPRRFIATGDDGMISLWNFNETGPATLVRKFGSHAGPIYSIALHPGGRLIATGSGTNEVRDVRIWDLSTGRELAGLDLLDQGVFDIEFSPDGRWLAAGGQIRAGFPDEGGEIFLVDLRSPHRAIAGNLEYHIARFTRDHGRAPGQAEGLRRLFPHDLAAGGADAGPRALSP